MKFLGIIVLTGLFLAIRANQVRLRVRNESERGCTVSWVNPKNGETSLMLNLKADTENEIGTYEGHAFEIQETGDCEETNSCLVTILTVPKGNTDHFFILDLSFRAVEGSKWQKITETPNDRMVRCREQTHKKLQSADSSSSKETQNLIAQDYTNCVKHGLVRALQKAEEKVSFTRQIAEELASGMETFTCMDPDVESTPDVSTRDWTSEKDGKTRTVHVKLDRPASRIHVIEDFAYQEECDAIQESAKDRLQPAGTVDGKGGSKLSDHRKALQASINPKWSEEENGDLITRVSRRVYDYVSYELGLDLDEHGQEPLMSIQYFGRGYNDTAPDRYKPHCDGGCDGLPFKPGTRMATMVIYCDIPEKGGHTNFRNAYVHVRPELRQAVFFSYIDPQTNLTDHG